MALLAGGEGRRMGSPKHLLRNKASGESLLQHQLRRFAMAPFQARYLVGHSQTIEVPEGWTQLPDPQGLQGEGPLAGILAALTATTSDRLAVLALDYPHLPSELLLGLAEEGREWCTYADNEGRPQWLCSVLSVSLRDELRKQMLAGGRSVHRFAKQQDLAVLEPPAGQQEAFLNLNRAEDLEDSGFEKPR